MVRKAKSIVKRTVNGDIEFDTVRKAAKSVPGADPKVIERALKGKQPTAYGYRWFYR